MQDLKINKIFPSWNLACDFEDRCFNRQDNFFHVQTLSSFFIPVKLKSHIITLQYNVSVMYDNVIKPSIVR
jgi:hypothetical protein